SSGEGIANGTPDALIVAFAREMRWAMVASGTRNAFAIWGVVRPPTARRVRAIADAAVRAGWQHMNRRRRLSSAALASVDAGSWNATRAPRLARDASLRF